MTNLPDAPSFVAVVNPISGGGASHQQWPAVAAELDRLGVHNVTVIESQSSEHATQVAAESAASGAITVAVGGDGHVRDVAKGVLTVDGARLGIAAAGRGNDLVRHLGLPSDPVDIARMLVGGQERRIDILNVKRADGSIALAVGNVYVGLDSVATELINKLRWMGPLAYRVAPVLTAIRWKPMRLTLSVDGQSRDLSAHFVVIANSGDYGHGLRMVPTAAVDSGHLDVFIVDGKTSKLRLAQLMAEAKSGAHGDRDDVEILTGQRVELTIDRPLPVHSDGDFLGTSPVTVEVRQQALPILVP
ncbi:diacylglycerol/lipid kinase family protein [Gordonia sp. (in: high G+C Gram-positive bacteria)]|uniref:diacylglycerol/lipid kinase family protein n=1 Tax=Gordonia sp. (in: high G+C Gram-positive bacteria) TaxID=84139 RepID=UPI003C75289A